MSQKKRPRRDLIGLDRSASSETDRHLPILNDHGDVSPPIRPLQHFRHSRWIGDHVHIVNGMPFFGVILTRSCRIGSGVFSIDQNGLVGHVNLLSGT